MRNYFEEMNVDYDELKKYEEIETYYDEIQDYSKLIQELQCDRVEALKQIVKKNKEIARLNKIIEEIETIFDTPYFDKEVSKQLGSNGFFTFKQMYEACNIVFKKRLKELKEEGK